MRFHSSLKGRKPPRSRCRSNFSTGHDSGLMFSPFSTSSSSSFGGRSPFALPTPHTFFLRSASHPSHLYPFTLSWVPLERSCPFYWLLFLLNLSICSRMYASHSFRPYIQFPIFLSSNLKCNVLLFCSHLKRFLRRTYIL